MIDIPLSTTEQAIMCPNAEAVSTGGLSGRVFKPTYLSPSAVNCFLYDRADYYNKYVLGLRTPTTKPMMVGTSFDFYIKNEIAKIAGVPSPFQNEKSTAPKQLLDVGCKTDVLQASTNNPLPVEGQIVFDDYVRLGGLSDLLLDIVTVPVMQSELITTCFGVPMKGYPDLYVMPTVEAPDVPKSLGLSVGKPLLFVHDWKVSGFCSQASPKPGYTSLLDGNMCKSIRGIAPLKRMDSAWEIQLVMYKWMIEQLHSGECSMLPFIGSIDQLVYRKTGVRVAKYRYVIGTAEQEEIAKCCRNIWTIINNPEFVKNPNLGFE
jgi:hypothetical protein